MHIDIKVIDNGIQHFNRLFFQGADNKIVYVDLWDDEMRELKEHIEQLFPNCEV